MVVLAEFKWYNPIGSLLWDVFNPLDSLVEWVYDSAISAFETVIGMVLDTGGLSDADVVSANIGMNQIAGLSAFICVGVSTYAIVRLMLAGRLAEIFAVAGKALMAWPLTVIVATLVVKGCDIADEVTALIMSGVAEGEYAEDPAGALADIPGLLLWLALLLLLGSGSLMLVMAARDYLLVLAIVLVSVPVMLNGWEATKPLLRKYGSWVLGLIIFQPLVAVMTSISLTMMDRADGGMQLLVAVVGCLLACVFPWVLVKQVAQFMPGSSGLVAAANAGRAAVTATVSTVASMMAMGASAAGMIGGAAGAAGQGAGAAAGGGKGALGSSSGSFDASAGKPTASGSPASSGSGSDAGSGDTVRPPGAKGVVKPESDDGSGGGAAAGAKAGAFMKAAGQSMHGPVGDLLTSAGNLTSTVSNLHAADSQSAEKTGVNATQALMQSAAASEGQAGSSSDGQDPKDVNVHVDVDGDGSRASGANGGQPFGPPAASSQDPASGSPGAYGVQGPSDVAGADGVNGSGGPAGPGGSTGGTGANGSNGISGSNGVNGAAGGSGANGANGANGVQGATGVNGTKGAQGADGADGVDGASTVVSSSQGVRIRVARPDDGGGA